MGYFHVIFPMSEKHFHDTHSRIQSHREMTRAHVHCRDHPAMVKKSTSTLKTRREKREECSPCWEEEEGEAKERGKEKKRSKKHDMKKEKYLGRMEHESQKRKGGKGGE